MESEEKRFKCLDHIYQNEPNAKVKSNCAQAMIVQRLFEAKADMK